MGIGIDLLNLAKIKKLIRKNPSRKFKSVLTPEEWKAWKKRRSALQLARYWTAKESVFKTLDQAWMGLEGFLKIEICRLRSDSFTAVAVHPKRGNVEVRGSFFRSGQLIGAEAFLWGNCALAVIG